VINFDKRCPKGIRSVDGTSAKAYTTRSDISSSIMLNRIPSSKKKRLGMRQKEEVKNEA